MNRKTIIDRKYVADILADYLTPCSTFEEFVNATQHRHPRITVKDSQGKLDLERVMFANLFDMAMIERGDPRRAVRGN